MDRPTPNRHNLTPHWRDKYRFPRTNRRRDRLTFVAKTVPGDPKRIDKYLVERFGGYSRSFFQQLLADGRVVLNGEKVTKNRHIKDADVITVFLEEGAPDIAEDIPFDILYEDDWLIVVVKPAGIVVHPARGNLTGTLHNALRGHFDSLFEADPEFRIYNLHRLDKYTSGVMVFGKEKWTTGRIGLQFERREVKKRYLLAVQGSVEWENCRCDLPLGHDPVNRHRIVIEGNNPRPSSTEFRRRVKTKEYSVLEAHPLTGRSHQIRVHIASLGYPIIGDVFYGGVSELPALGYAADRSFLHAWTLSFYHPRLEKMMTFAAPLPDDFIELTGPISPTGL